MEEKDRWEQKGRIFLLFISFTSFSIASLSPVYLPSLPTIYHPTLVHRHYGNAKRALLTYLKEQFSARVLLRNGLYNSIPQNSKYRMHKKPFKLRMEPYKEVGEKITTKDKVQCLTSLLQIMKVEDLGRLNEPNVELSEYRCYGLTTL